MASITQADNEMAEIYGVSAEDIAQAREQSELPAGTYDFSIAGSKVEIVSKETSKLKGALQVNLQLKPKAADGSTAKRYGTIFKRINVPVANGEFKPSGGILSMALADMKWLSEMTGVSQRDLVTSFKNMQTPAGVLTATVRGYFKNRQDKDDATKTWPEVRPAKSSDKLTALAPDGQKSAVAVMPSASDDSVPF